MHRFMCCVVVCAVWGTAWVQAETVAAKWWEWSSNRPQTLTNQRQEITVVNVWATWCAPCRQEMPALSRWYRQQQKQRQAWPVRMVGVALDQPGNIGRFLKQTPVSYPIWRFEGDSVAWMNSLGNPVGGLPFTVVLAERCGFRQPLLGVVDQPKLDAAVRSARQQCARRGG